ncbi:desmoplakin [Mocis latipes granulovirus]|uniref:Desmoplakin n=1 Tax=Mocis latipes granulovirus TaxID=2072024 RepID=A0A162GW22_9BBAC|nr:desmoplakin [Mocis latipes granulovirus]AKR17458.1 desmoplakin [Mocis latipes granulovirus]
MMLTRYKGVDVNPHTVHNLIRTIVSKQANTNDNDYALRSIIFSFRPDLINTSLTTDNLLITALKDCRKKEVTYNYKYESAAIGGHEEHHVAAAVQQQPDIFLKIWRLQNIEREDACVLAAAVRDLCYAVLKNAHPDFDPDHDQSAATLLKLCTEVRHKKQYVYEESQAMNREMQDLEKDLMESKARAAELMASFSSCKVEYEQKLYMALQNKQTSENEVARLELMLLEKNEHANLLQQTIDRLTAESKALHDSNERVSCEQTVLLGQIKELTDTIKEQAAQLKYIEEQHKTIENNNDTRLVLLNKEHSENIRVLNEKHSLKMEEINNELSLLQQHYVQQTTLAEELHKRLQKTDEHNKFLQAQNIDISKNLDNMQSQFNNLFKENLMLKSEIESLKLINAQDCDSNSQLQDVNKKLKKQNDALLLQLDVVHKDKEDLNKELEKIKNENDENVDAADRLYNLQKGELNRLELELNTAVDKLKAVTEELKSAQNTIAEQNKTIDLCNYEISALSQKNKSNSATLEPPKIIVSKTLKLPVKHKLDTTPGASNLNSKIAKKTLTWNINKLYGVNNQDDLNRLISQITVKNKKNKDWPIYSKFLSCTNVGLDKLKENPEYQGLDEDFKLLLAKQREFMDAPEQETSLFS